MSNLEQVQAEADEFAVEYGTMDDGYCNGREEGFVAGRTVTAEQVEAAAKMMWGRSPFIEALETTWEEWSRRNPAAAETWRENVRLTLTTAGLLIEGDE